MTSGVGVKVTPTGPFHMLTRHPPRGIHGRRARGHRATTRPAPTPEPKPNEPEEATDVSQNLAGSPELAAAAPTPLPPGLREYEALTPAQKAELTKKAQRRATGFRNGDQVRTNTPRSPRFHNRVGVVSATNLGEVGVSFSRVRPDGRPNSEAWFLPSELTKVTPVTRDESIYPGMR